MICICKFPLEEIEAPRQWWRAWSNFLLTPWIIRPHIINYLSLSIVHTALYWQARLSPPHPEYTCESRPSWHHSIAWGVGGIWDNQLIVPYIPIIAHHYCLIWMGTSGDDHTQRVHSCGLFKPGKLGQVPPWFPSGPKLKSPSLEKPPLVAFAFLIIA